MSSENVVSIIVPVYKVEAYLHRCVDSILAQTYKSIEIILVDDGSPDKCPEICDDYKKTDDRIHVIHKENGGLASARLAGFECASGEYVLFIDSDDFIEPTMVEKLVYSIESTDAGIAICSYYVDMGKNIEKITLPFDKTSIDGKDAVREKYILPLIGNPSGEKAIPGFLCIRLLKKSLIQRHFFGSEREFYLEDHYFDLLYADNVKKISLVNEPLYHYCVNSASLSNCRRENKWGMYQNLYRFYQKYISDRGFDVGDRIDYFLVSALFSSVDNAVMIGNYARFKSEVKDIISSEYGKRAFAFSEKIHVSKMEKLTMLLVKFRCFKFLYLIRKSRLEKIQ